MSSQIDDIQRFLFDVSTYSDLTIVVGDRSIYVHSKLIYTIYLSTITNSIIEAVLFARLPSFMEKIAKVKP